MLDSFEKVINDNQERIRYIAARYSGASDFEDIYQEILTQLWRSFDSFKGNSSRATWLYKVALNTASSFVTKTIKHKELQQEIALHVQQSASMQNESCQADILESFMSMLNDVDASLLMMYLDNMSSDEMAEVSGITSNAVRSRLKRIKQSFEQKFVGES